MCIEITEIDDWLAFAVPCVCEPGIVFRDFEIRITRDAITLNFLVRNKLTLARDVKKT
jgi:predicted cupin superfamily sugar epimerase